MGSRRSPGFFVIATARSTSWCHGGSERRATIWGGPGHLTRYPARHGPAVIEASLTGDAAAERGIDATTGDPGTGTGARHRWGGEQRQLENTC